MVNCVKRIKQRAWNERIYLCHWSSFRQGWPTRVCGSVREPQVCTHRLYDCRCAIGFIPERLPSFLSNLVPMLKLDWKRSSVGCISKRLVAKDYGCIELARNGSTCGIGKLCPFQQFGSVTNHFRASGWQFVHHVRIIRLHKLFHVFPLLFACLFCHNRIADSALFAMLVVVFDLLKFLSHQGFFRSLLVRRHHNGTNEGWLGIVSHFPDEDIPVGIPSWTPATYNE